MAEIQNVVLLSVDALRADHLSFHGYERDTSPFLADLASDAVSFDRAISPSSHTREAVPALLTGRYPDTFANNGYRLVRSSVGDRLSAAGYATAAFHSNPYVSRAYDFDSGFDVFDDNLMLGQNRLVALFERFLNKFVLNKGEYHTRAEEINEQSLGWIDGLDDGPFFLWNHYMDTHGPYNPPVGFDRFSERSVSNSDAQRLYQKSIKEPENVTKEENRLLIDLYDGEIRYLDAQLRHMIDGLDERGLLEDTLVILTADHGDGFDEHGYYTHPRRLHEELLRVPLLVLHPDRDPKRVEKLVSTLSVVPTILAAAGGQDDTLPRDDLFAEIEDESDGSRTVFASATGEDGDVRRFAVRDRRYKVVIERRLDDGEIVSETGFDLHADPGEQEQIREFDGRLTELHDQLYTFGNTRLGTVDAEMEAEKLDSEIEDRLEVLGYK
ncbi:sulfatase [Haladaptatus sp. AB643]|uniref:sulfatase n=1 Tax=Haladaptatus sp. AB643 TaxID=2934174 RepID=UPI00209C29F5|nr:sulfatase [Haladaptatus sp. AB643]MCO8244765.1 sulfatase [Haladaptatus sp. AB643]